MRTQGLVPRNRKGGVCGPALSFSPCIFVNDSVYFLPTGKGPGTWSWSKPSIAGNKVSSLESGFSGSVIHYGSGAGEPRYMNGRQLCVAVPAGFEPAFSP